MQLSDVELLNIVQEQVGTMPLDEDPSEFTTADVHMRLRNDNAVVKLLPALPEASGLHLARPRKVPCTVCVRKGNGKCRLCNGSTLMKNPYLEPLVEAEVLAVGPGYFTESGAFVPLEVKVGDIVLVEPECGDRYRYRHDVRVIRTGGLWEGRFFKHGEVWAVKEFWYE